MSTDPTDALLTSIRAVVGGLAKTYKFSEHDAMRTLAYEGINIGAAPENIVMSIAATLSVIYRFNKFEALVNLHTQMAHVRLINRHSIVDAMDCLQRYAGV
jgi:hypothetical protein